ncbi:MAG: SDR family oxidoreductase [Bacteroidetes bacterium]|nr:SDR family oxidoreductase [Bacteroidota bacterium]
MKKYNDINIGDKETLSHIITKADIEKFVQLTGDDNRLHVDEKFASKTQFKKPVVHGMLGASFISTIIGTKLPGDGALWFSQSLEFLLPVRIGDTLTVTAEVIKKNDKEQIIELKTEILNQNRQIVTKGIAKVKVIETEDKIVENEHIEPKTKTALVIGGTGGIGKATCIQLAKDGFNVIIHYNKNKSLAEEIKNEIELLNQNAIIVRADILNIEDIKEMVSKAIRAFENIDVIVNCAATVIPNIKFQDLVWTDYLQQLELNIKSTFLIIKEIMPSMIKNGYGKIINIGSLSAEKPNADWSHYITAKSALIGLTKSLAFELAPKGIRINMVTPSLVSTELTADIPEKFKLLTAAQTPLRRLALAKDVAGTISFLASEKSDFLTGENIRVNGGQVMI